MSIEYDTTCIDICNYFSEEEINMMARKLGFVERKSAITGFNFLVTFTLGLMHIGEATLMKLSSFLGTISDKEISPQALDERINSKSQTLLKNCLNTIIRWSYGIKDECNPLTECFRHIYISDSTSFDLHPSLKNKYKGIGGNASPATMKIHYTYDYIDGQIDLKIGGWCESDAARLTSLIESRELPFEENSLYIQDLGYFNQETFSKIDRLKGYFLSKIKFGIRLYDCSDNLINLKNIIKGNPVDIDIQIKMAGRIFRLVGNRASDGAIQKKIRKAKINSKKKTLSDEYLLFLSYNLYITNLPQEYSCDDLYTLYRIRWQIELIFKVWKSLLKIHTVHSAKESRVLCEIYGKLIIATILFKLYYGINLKTESSYSYHKIVQYGKSIAMKWAIILMKGFEAHQKFLMSLNKLLLRFCKKHKQITKPRIEDRIKMLSVPPEFSMKVLKVA